MLFQHKLRAGFTVVAVFIVLGFFGTYFRYSRTHVSYSEESHFPIAMILKDMKNPFFVEVRDGALSAAAKLHANLVVASTNDESEFEEQNKLVIDYINRGAKVLLIAPNHHQKIIPAIRAANAAGVPVIIMDVPMEDSEVEKNNISILSQIHSDNLRGGQLAAQLIAKEYPNGADVALLGGRSSENNYGPCRERGFLDEIKNHPQLRLIHQEYTNWSKQRAKEISYQWLKGRRAPDVIFAASDFIVSGIFEAMNDLGFHAPISIIGYDATREAQRSILNGKLVASIAQDPSRMGELAVEYAVRHLRGEKLPKRTLTPVSLVYGVRELRMVSAVEP